MESWCHMGPMESCTRLMHLYLVYGVWCHMGPWYLSKSVRERRCREWESNPSLLDQSQVVNPLGHRGLWDSESISMASILLELLVEGLCLLFRLSQEEMMIRFELCLDLKSRLSIAPLIPFSLTRFAMAHGLTSDAFFMIVPTWLENPTCQPPVLLLCPEGIKAFWALDL